MIDALYNCSARLFIFTFLLILAAGGLLIYFTSSTVVSLFIDWPERLVALGARENFNVMGC